MEGEGVATMDQPMTQSLLSSCPYDGIRGANVSLQNLHP